jgi:hypothetical protein
MEIHAHVGEIKISYLLNFYMIIGFALATILTVICCRISGFLILMNYSPELFHFLLKGENRQVRVSKLLT